MSFRHTTTFAIAAAAALLSGVALAQAEDLKVTITNLTKGQPISPPVVVSHRKSIALATPGEPASEGLRFVAEDGNPDPLAQALEGLSQVRDVAVADGAVPPSQSTTVFLRARRGDVISAVGMLVNTNDAFFFLDSQRQPFLRAVEVEVAAWDSGTEANTEVCDDIPGPACGAPNARSTESAEGFVHVHRGVHGANVEADGEEADLRPELYDWRNPSVRITIERARRGKDDAEDEDDNG